MAEGVVRGVAYRPRQRVLLAARLECRLAAGPRPRNGDERCSLALWAVRVLDQVLNCLGRQFESRRYFVSQHLA